MAELRDAIARVADTETLLVALDFDGTLAPLVDDPAQSRATPEAQQALLDLAELPRTRVALVSGRAMASLIEVSAVPESVLLSGSHGVEVRLDEQPSLALEADELARVARLGEALGEVADRYQHAWVEQKPAGFALHTRLASTSDAELAQRDALAAADSITGMTVRRGKDVLEFSVRSTNKGDAVERLREHSGATAVFFAGDDVTDEDAFASLRPGDLGVKCGPGETRAPFRVAAPADVAEVLHELVRARRTRVLAG